MKTLVIAFMLLDVLAIFLVTGNFDDNRAERPPLHGAYEVTQFVSNHDTLPSSELVENRWKRVFVHRHGYFITGEYARGF